MNTTIKNIIVFSSKIDKKFSESPTVRSENLFQFIMIQTKKRTAYDWEITITQKK